MSDTEQREIAKTFIEPRQARQEIRDALKLEEERRAALVKNLYRLRRSSVTGREQHAHSGKVKWWLRSAQIHPFQ